MHGELATSQQRSDEPLRSGKDPGGAAEPPPAAPPEAGKCRRGFAAMDRDKQRAIARRGGQAAHAKGTAHRFSSEEARAAGRKGGQAAHAKGTAHRFSPKEARAAARKARATAGGETAGLPKEASGGSADMP